MKLNNCDSKINCGELVGEVDAGADRTRPFCQVGTLVKTAILLQVNAAGTQIFTAVIVVKDL